MDVMFKSSFIQEKTWIKTLGFQNLSGPLQPTVVIFEKRSINIFFLLARSLCDSEMRLNEICWRVNHTLKLVFCLETDSFGKPFYQYLTSGKCTDSSTILTRPLFRIPFMFNNNLPKINSKCYHSWLCLYNKLAGKEE